MQWLDKILFKLGYIRKAELELVQKQLLDTKQELKEVVFTPESSTSRMIMFRLYMERDMDRCIWFGSRDSPSNGILDRISESEYTYSPITTKIVEQ
jgi:ATP-dependent protease ClpP protease subunit